jgi:hypothetical protein
MIANLRLLRRATLRLAVGAVLVVAVVVSLIAVIGHRSSRATTAGATTTTQQAHQVSFSSEVVLPFADVENPAEVAVDTANNVYVADYGLGRVLKLPSDDRVAEPRRAPFA